MPTTVRIIDRSSAQQHGIVPAPARDAHRRFEDEPGKPSIDDKRSYYWSGPGWLAAFSEAKRLMASGLTAERAAPQVGWTTEDLESAIARDGRPPEQPLAAEDFHPRERPRRTVKQRVAGLHGVSQETQDLARRFYEVEIMTVREVAKALELPYEKCYLVLIKADTKFRRPGRRGSDMEPEPRVVEPVEEQVVKEVKSVKVKARPACRDGRKSEAEKALRRVLGRMSSHSAPRTHTTRTRVARRTEAEKALRRVIG